MFVLIYSIGSAGQIICRIIGTGTLVRYLSRISGTYPYESDGITINSQRLNFLFLQACGI